MSELREAELSSLINQLEQDFDPFITQMKVRRMLIERFQSGSMSVTDSARLGTYVPPPFDQSNLIIRTIGGEVVEGVQHYAARISANAPQPVVPRITESSRVSKSIEENAAEQERLLSALWVSAGGPSRQYQIGWSQSWCRSGWYLTLPRDASWGLPDRSYFTELSDDELEKMRDNEYLSPEKSDDGKWMESGANWIKRRREAAKKNAIDGNALFTLEAIPGDMVRFRSDRDGVKFAYVVEEVPSSDFRPGSDMMKDLARRSDVPEAEIARFGISIRDGKVVMGTTAGGEEDSVNHTGSSAFNFIRAFDRECTYYLVAGQGRMSSAKLIWHAPHGAGKVPLIPVPGIRTDSRRPGSEFSCPMEQVFAYAPLLNQIETLLSNAAAYNALPRYVIEKEDGSIIVDEKGDPKTVVGGPTPGLDPSEAQMVEGKLRQLVIDAGLLERLLGIYAQQLDKAMPPDVTRGEGGTSGAAWAVRQLLSAAQADLEQPVSNHALAVKEIFEIWTRWLRLLDVPVYALSIPRNRGNMRAVRGLIEFDPADLVGGFEVVQSKDSASDRIVLQQHGNELLKAGLIDMRRYLEQYALEPDPVQAEKDLWVQKTVDIVMGVGPPAPPNTVLAQVVQAVQGRLFLSMMERSPNAALMQAELLAMQGQMQNPAQQGMTVSGTPTNMQPEGGNPAEVNGMRQPGIGMGASLQGTPESGVNAMAGMAQ